jgi:hypothetical protein
MPATKASGEENLRADPSVYYNAGKDTPGGKGTDAGGTENKGATTEVKMGSVKATPSLKDSHPDGVQTFQEGSV